VEGASGETTEPLTKIAWLHSLWRTFPIATGTESTFVSGFALGEQEATTMHIENIEKKDAKNRKIDITKILLLNGRPWLFSSNLLSS
jgi:hypothetical protein